MTLTLDQVYWMLNTVALQQAELPRSGVEWYDLETSMCDLRALLFMLRGWHPDQLDPAEGGPVDWEICQICTHMFPELLDRMDLQDLHPLRVCNSCADTAYVGYCEPAEA